MKLSSSSGKALNVTGNKPAANVLIIFLYNISLPKLLPTLDLEYVKADPISYPLSYPVEKVEAKWSTHSKISFAPAYYEDRFL